MKKKFLSLLIIAVFAISLVACGSDQPAEEDTPETESAEESEQNQTEEVSVPEASETSDVYFKDDVLKINMATIKLTGVEVAPPNTDFGEEKSTLIITYDFTNDSDNVMQPGVTWIACFTATQETETTIDELDAAMMPQDEKYTEMNDMSYADVKPGATVQAVISYEINDTEQPVVLKATQGIAGEELGEKIYELK